MTDTPLLTIVIPYYSTPRNDRSGMLRDLLASIPDRPDLEVIVVDDLSDPPCTAEPGFAATRFMLTRTPYQSRYAGAARNHGLALAAGTYVMNADSDDLFVPEVLEGLMNSLSEMNPGDEEIVVHLVGCAAFSGAGDLLGAPLYQNTMTGAGPDEARNLLRWHAPWGKIISRKALDLGVRFREDHIVDDLMFSALLALKATRVERHPEITYMVRRDHGVGALTARTDSAAVAARIDAQRDVNTLLKNAGAPHLQIPLHHAFRAHFNSAPWIVAKEIIRSLWRRDQILPARFSKAIKKA